jgi:hypothetical protein
MTTHHFPTTAFAITLAFAVSLHAMEADIHCIAHPISLSCADPHNEPIEPQIVFVQPTVAANSSSNTVHLLG